MKKILLFGLMFLTFFLCGCDKERTIVVLNAKPITKANVFEVQQAFNVNQKIHYAVLAPKGFKDKVIRVQIVKKDEKTQHWGYQIAESQDKYIDSKKKFYIDYFVAHEKGYFLIRVYELKNLDTPIARSDFWVIE